AMAIFQKIQRIGKAGEGRFVARGLPMKTIRMHANAEPVRASRRFGSKNSRPSNDSSAGSRQERQSFAPADHLTPLCNSNGSQFRIPRRAIWFGQQSGGLGVA